MHNKFFFIGFLSTCIAAWERFVVEPTAPSNYKDLNKINAWVADARDKQETRVGRMPITAWLKHVVILNHKGEKVLNVTGDKPGVVAQDLAKFLLAEFPSGLNSEEGYGLTQPMIGFDAKVMLRIMALEIFHNNKMHPTNAIVLPPKMWQNPSVADPYEILLSGDDRKEFDLGGLCEWLNIPCPEDLADNPLTQAELAMQLAETGCFHPTLEQLQS